MAKVRGHLVTTDDPQDDVAIRVQNVSKSFKLPHNKQNSIKGGLINIFNGDRSYEEQEVLKDVSFEIKKGEFFGIVGRNGSGKSTLLKMLAGIYTPSSGNIVINGSLTPFIELGVGFNPELTGRENVFLNGALLGFNRNEMAAMYDDIVEFAELERFMDQKLKNYSSGMQVRLAFSIAIRARSGILLIDEVLAVGDASFQQKCYEYFTNIKRGGQTLVLVTHDMTAVSRFCDRALLISDGGILQIGCPKDITDAYLELNYTEGAVGSLHGETNASGGTIHIVSVTLSGERAHAATNNRPITLQANSRATAVIEFTNDGRDKVHVGLQLFNESGTYCFGTNTAICGLEPIGKRNACFELDFGLSLVAGKYTITAAIMNATGSKVLVYRPKVASLIVSNESMVEGVAELNHSWRVL